MIPYPPAALPAWLAHVAAVVRGVVALVLCALLLGLGVAALALPEDEAMVQRAARVRLAVLP